MENKIAEIRKSIHMSQACLAEIAGVSRPSISKIETGKQKVIRTDTMKKISIALKRPIYDIFFA